MTDCCNKERQPSKTLYSLCVTVTDDVLKLGYTSVIFLDLGVKVDGTYYTTVADVMSLGNLCFRKQCHNIQGTLCFQTLIFHKVV